MRFPYNALSVTECNSYDKLAYLCHNAVVISYSVLLILTEVAKREIRRAQYLDSRTTSCHSMTVMPRIFLLIITVKYVVLVTRYNGNVCLWLYRVVGSVKCNCLMRIVAVFT